MLALLTAALLATAPPAPPPLLVVLTGTGQNRDGLPVLTRRADAAAVETVLSRGYSGRLLRLYRLHQIERARREGTAVEPAYLFLSKNQGGFPRSGFWLEGEKKAAVGYVDLQEDQRLSGDFGAVDQIFPHELLHVIVSQTAGPPPEGGSNQVHAIAVRTDPVIAFNEGFAEHAQVMAIDDPDASPDTRALASDGASRARAEARFEAYVRALSARVAVAPAATAAFPLWFSHAEQVARYHGVKANRFDREPVVPERLLRGPDPYAAYLIESVVPGDPAGPRKPLARALSSEGVVSALFHRWVTEPRLQATGGAETDAAADGLDRAYLKLFHVIREAKPTTTAQLIRAYRGAYPDEDGAVDVVLTDVLGDARLPEAPEIWLACDAFDTGTSLFDQRRALPRKHTFDLNAASVVDLLAVPGVDLKTARAVLAGGPYRSVDDLARVPGAAAALVERFRAMERGMVKLRADAAEEETVMSLKAILMPYAWSALRVWLIAGLLGAAAFRAVRPVGPWRALLGGIGAALAVLATGWLTGPGTDAYPLVVPLVLFAVPGTAFAAIARRERLAPWRVAAAWLGASLPAWIALRPWF